VTSLLLLILLLTLALVLLTTGGATWALRASRATAPPPSADGRAVVLVHGICGFDKLPLFGLGQHYFRGVSAHLARGGVPVYAARLSPLGSVPQRAQQLASLIRSLPHDRVTIVAHSLGGLDARYAISHLGLHPRVTELVTVGTPHRGTPIADLAARPPAIAARRMARKLGLCTDALDWLTPASMERFNQEVRDVPGVTYTSVVGTPTLGRMWRNPILLAGFLYLRRRAGNSDGMVPTESQRWGSRVIEVPVHHFGQVGWSLRGHAGRFYERLLCGLDPVGCEPLQLPAAVPVRAPTDS
jgi:triacylglycerol lipase